MKKLIFTAVFLLLFIGTAFPQGVDWFDGTLDDAKIAAEKAGKLIIIDIGAKSG